MASQRHWPVAATAISQEQTKETAPNGRLILPKVYAPGGAPVYVVPADEGHNRRRTEPGYDYIVRQLSLFHARLRLAVYCKAAGVLPGFTKADAGSAEARALFDEALLEAVTAATAAGLLALVNALTEPQGGAAVQES